MPKRKEFKPRIEEIKAAVKSRDYEEVIRLIDSIFDDFEVNDPEHYAFFLGIKADALFGLEKYEEAIKSYSQAFEKDQSESRYLANQAQAKLNLSKYVEAVFDFDGAIFLKPQNGAYFHQCAAI